MMISVNKDFDDIPVGLIKKGYRAAPVRARLEEIYHGKCAYSEEKLAVTGVLEINHYRPKTKYPWLENEWSNLHLVCKRCNMAAGDHFPVQGRRIEKPPPDKKKWRADSQLLRSEKPVLLNPEIDTPENHLSFEPNGIIYGTTKRGEVTIQVFQLNNENLILARRQKIDSFRGRFEDQFELFVHYLKNRSHSFASKNDIYNFLFENLFQKLKQAGEPQFEFSLLGRVMLENFELFFIRYFEQKIPPEDREKSGFNLYLDILVKAKTLFTKTDDILKFKKTEKKIPLFPKAPTKDKRMQKGLPYAIKAFEITKYYGIKHTQIQNLPINTRWIFLTGENGFGKTLVLQALALGLYGKEDNGRLLADENCRVKIEMKHKENNLINIAGSRDQDRFENFAAYGPGRLNIDGDVFEGKQAPEKVGKTDSLFQNTSSLFNIQEYLIQIHGRKEFENKFNAIIHALKRLLPWVEDIIVDESAEKKKILYCERTENGELLEEIPFGALSAGSKSIIAMIGDMLIEFFKNQEVTDPANLEGIVIIDELDIHLHAKWQREFVIRLTDLFPKVQFIASTHSPIPLLGAPPETVVLNVEKRSKKEGIVVRRLHIDVTKLTPNTILTSPIFDFEEIIPKAHDRKEPLHTEDEYSETVFNRMLEKKLDKLAKAGGKSLEELIKGNADDSCV